jgi:hypothetical protein
VIGTKAKELNKELETLISRLKGARPIEYDHGKIDYLYSVTEKAFEAKDLVNLITERLRALEQIHEDSTTIAESFEAVEVRQSELEAQLAVEANIVNETKELMVKSVKAIQETLHTLTA